MKIWVKVIFGLNGKLNTLVAGLDKKMVQAAMSFGDTYTQCSKIMDMIEFRRVAVNMRVIYNAMVKRLRSEEVRALEGTYAYDRPVSCIADEIGIGRGEVLGMLDAAINKCIDCLRDLGYNSDRLEVDYSDMYIFRDAYIKHSAPRNTRDRREIAKKDKPSSRSKKKAVLNTTIVAADSAARM